MLLVQEEQPTAAVSGLLPASMAPRSSRASTKLDALCAMLKAAAELSEKVVIVSTSTQMLDAAQLVCSGLGLTAGRIDGSTAAAARQELVDTFNDPCPPSGESLQVCNTYAPHIASCSPGCHLQLIHCAHDRHDSSVASVAGVSAFNSRRWGWA
jgi:hypothetical protein